MRIIKLTITDNGDNTCSLNINSEPDKNSTDAENITAINVKNAIIGAFNVVKDNKKVEKVNKKGKSDKNEN